MAADIAAVWIIYPWICLVREVLSPLKILLWLCILAVPQVQAVTAARCPSELTGRPTKLDHLYRNRKNLFEAFFTTTSIFITNFPLPILHSSADLESPVLVPKKMELTRENINALLSSSSFKEKTSSTFSRGSTQTSGGRGQGKRQKELDPSVQLASGGRCTLGHTACHYQPFNAVKLLSICFQRDW